LSIGYGSGTGVSGTREAPGSNFQSGSMSNPTTLVADRYTELWRGECFDQDSEGRRTVLRTYVFVARLLGPDEDSKVSQFGEDVESGRLQDELGLNPPAEAKRQRFVPRAGMEDKSSWTLLPEGSALHPSGWAAMAQLTLGGKARFTHPGDEEPFLEIELLKGDTDWLQLAIQDLAPGNEMKDLKITVRRGEPASILVDGVGYKVLFPNQQVALDQPDTTAFATVMILEATEGELSAEQASIARLIISKERGGQWSPEGILYTLDGEVVAMEKLQERFQQMVKERPELQVIVYANDPEVPAGRPIAAMQTARAAGVKSVRLARPPKESADGSEKPNHGTFRISKAYSDEMPGHVKMNLRGKSGSEALWVADEVIASREDLMSIMAGETEGILVIQLNEESGKRMRQVTEGMRKGRDRLAMIVDGFPVAAPTVMATLGDRVEIHVPSELSKEVIQRIGGKSGAIGADGSSHDESVTEHPARAETIDEGPTARLTIKQPDGSEEVGSLRDEGIDLLREVLSREPDHVRPADRGAPLVPPILLEWEGNKYAVQSDKIVLIGEEDWTMWLSPGTDEKLIEHSDVRVIQGAIQGTAVVGHKTGFGTLAGAIGFPLLAALGFLMHRRLNRERRLEKTALFLCVSGVIVPLLILIGQLLGMEQAVVAAVAFVLFAVMQLAALILGIIRFSEPLGRAAAIASGVLLLGSILFLS
jgi:hypothetical protein